MKHILTCDSTGTCRVQSMPLLGQNDPRLLKSPDGPKKLADCYDASISEVAQAALLSRDTSRFPKASGRTGDFLNIDDSGSGSEIIPAAVNRLAWQVTFAGTEKAFYFPEVIADLEPIIQKVDPRVYSGGSTVTVTSEHCATFRNWTSPATRHITNDYVKWLLDHDFVVMLGYAHAQPTATKIGTTWRVSFTKANQHKVGVSGYRKGPFPLRIFDVGEGVGNERWARLTFDYLERDFGQPGARGGAITDLVFSDDLRGRVRLAWEDPKEPNDTASFVEQIDALSLYWEPPKQAFAGQWGGGWTSLMPFVESGKPSFIAYNRATGQVHSTGWQAPGRPRHGRPGGLTAGATSFPS